MDEYQREMQEFYKRTLPSDQKQFKGVVCPSTFDKMGGEKHKCALCDLCKGVLFDRTIAKEDPLRKRASELNSKNTYYSNILIMANPSEIVVLEYGTKIFNQLIAGQMDALSEWKEFMHPVTGRNLYIKKIQLGANIRDVDYKVEPRMGTSKIPDPTVLKKLIDPNGPYYLSNILALMDSEKIKTIRQGKLFAPGIDRVEIRVLPSWLGPQTSKFFERVNYHYIPKEDYDACQRGEFDPVRITGIINKPIEKAKIVTATEVVTLQQAEKELWGDWKDVQPLPTSSDAKVQKVSTAPILEDEEPELDGDPEPLCHGQYDEGNPACSTKCIEDGWAESCKLIQKERQARVGARVKARRLSPK